MLTSNYISNEGKKCSSENEQFIEKLFEQKKSSIGQLIKLELSEAKSIFDEIKKNFKDSKIELVYKPEELVFFSNQKKEREKYFKSYLSKVVEKQLIFFDPDNGFEPQKVEYTEKHIQYKEIVKFLDKMNDASVIVVYQHQPLGVSWENFELKKNKLTNCHIFKINSDSDVACFLIAKKELKINKEKYTLENFEIS